MMSDFNNKNFILNQALWLGISLAISIAISLIRTIPLLITHYNWSFPSSKLLYQTATV